MNSQPIRRSGRISKQIPILIMGSDCDGRVFSENTHTVVLSLHGAGIVSEEKLLPEQELTLRAVETNQDAQIRVVGEIGSQGNLHTYGVAFVDERLDFWKISFPPAALPTVQSLKLYLACSACHSTFVVENGEFEFDVCAIHGGLVRFCDFCGYSTVWKTAHPPRVVAAPVKAEKRVAAESNYSGISLLVENGVKTITNGFVQPLAEIPKVEQSNRRSRVRAKVSYQACVRSEAFGDDIVRCIDMSRGGVAFKTTRKYVMNMIVRIAVPYSPSAAGAPVIFVDARIANIRNLDFEMYRVGVEFLPKR